LTTQFSVVKIGAERFERILQAFEETVGARVDTAIALKFLRVGFAYFKRHDSNALLELAREERLTFRRRLGIELPGD
jgi:hypothetical protein